MGMRRPFTLVELLVVISIIAILMALLLPTLEKAKALGARLSCASNLKQLSVGIFVYSSDYSDYAPTTYGDPASSYYPTWAQKLVPYENDNYKVFACQADKVARTSYGSPLSTYPRTYAINLFISEPLKAQAGYVADNHYSLAVRLSRIKAPALLTTLCEAAPTAEMTVTSTPYSNLYGTSWETTHGTLHGAVSNFAYADGHVLAEAWKRKTHSYALPNARYWLPLMQ